MPFAASGLRVERDHRIGIQVVALAVVTDHVRPGVADGPVQRVELRVVAAGHPRRRARMIDRVALPCFRPGLAARRDGPESPDLLAGRLLVGRNESARALIPSGDACDHQIADDHRRAGAVVVLAPVGHLRLPQERAAGTIERDEMRVVGRHEDALAADCDAAIDASGRNTGQPTRARAPVVPDLAPTAGIECVEIVRRADVHQAVHDDRRHLHLRHVGQREDPLRREARDIVSRDLSQRAVAVSAGLAVVCRPAALRRHCTIAARRRLTQQMRAAIVAEYLHLADTLIQEDA